MQSATIHIKVEPKAARELKELSKKRELSVGELVRQALFSCYQIGMLPLGRKQQYALEAFQGGYISQGKLAEEMGMTIWETRKWLYEHDIPANYSFLEDDVNNA